FRDLARGQLEVHHSRLAKQHGDVFGLDRFKTLLGDRYVVSSDRSSRELEASRRVGRSIERTNQCRARNGDLGARDDRAGLILNHSLNATRVLLSKSRERRAEWSENHGPE